MKKLFGTLVVLAMLLVSAFHWVNAGKIDQSDVASYLSEMYSSGQVNLISDIVIDESSMPDDVFFEGVSDVAVSSSGRIYVLDLQAGNIKIFGPGGQFEKVIGNKGQGPGEFNSPILIAVSEDRLFVWDARVRKILTFTNDGIFIKSLAFDLDRKESDSNIPSMMIPSLRKMRTLPNGDLIIEICHNYYQEEVKPQDCLIEIYSPELEHKETLYSRPQWYAKLMFIKTGFTDIPTPFSAQVQWDVAPDGTIVIGYPESYTIEIYASGKGKIRSFGHPSKPVKVTESEKKDFLESLRYTFSMGGVTTIKEPPAIILENIEFPKNKPVFSSVFFDSKGNILVGVEKKESTEQTTFFDVFSPEGKFIKNIRMNGEKSIDSKSNVFFTENGLWMKITDDEGLVKIVKFRMSLSQ